MELPVLYTKKEVCRIIKCSRSEIDRIILRGDLAYDYKRGTVALFKEETIINYLESIKVNLA
ncbi:hypothetical protein M2459_001382 [Parabacteroides sp. PF5-5]|uniref:helix-turn-helix domain-containing protein n=1 Tax=Parabacteroides sp. PH5-16 TaxID=2940625 RepID=UPI00247D1282|nr:hypothetical protein [Parabacteroides sp. PH5-39]MDH6315740.1 hypothetical protein [Parabacteroides sp. PF5-13]MDH6319400.1 hypothetical protein [Parabacteroides sp. PH5-13]MDH6323131.1 hypothetical protein [Parabacteroides sp. PH5-8]MDH6326933.1 hypothetical protein [Parabacteroides sp. PH5-41]MDH6334638.1 hypothetical protein [Parabacteroides sp. PF5-5]MDH6345702.1 hypothetical protein [Parabacteroides sp. PH5-46]MDH6360658.1 hypothetical protein [Parabacteroides sp. PH5-16]MDH6376420.